MKKSFSIFFILFMFILNVNVVSALEAKGPVEVPKEGDLLYASVDEAFDYSAISFSSVPEGISIKGRDIMMKIMLDKSNAPLSSSWFTAYCLDGMKKYPIFYKEPLENLPDDVSMLKQSAVIMLFKDSAFATIFGQVGNYDFISVYGPDNSIDDATNYKNGNEVSVSISKIEFYKGTDVFATVTAEQLNQAKGVSSTADYSVKFKKSDLQYDIYTTLGLPDSVYYNTALWIIEHSYPTLSLELSLEKAGASYSKLLNDVKALHPTYTDAQIKEAAENYVYSTVQYAIWKKSDGFKYNHGGNEYELGDTLYGSEQLNILYQYLIADREEFSADYSNYDFTNKINITKPEEGKNIYKEDSDNYMFGPYKVSSDMLIMGDVSLSVVNDDKTGISIIDRSGNAVSTIKENGEFFIKVSKDSKATSVEVKVEVKNALSFKDSRANRARLYAPSTLFEQVVASGGKAEVINVSETLKLDLNPKTGVQDVGMVILVGLIAFSVGYLVLKYKGEALEI